MAAYNVLRYVDSSAGVTMLLYQNASGELELKAPGADGTTLCTTTGWVFEDSTLHNIVVTYAAGTFDGVARIESVASDGSRTTRGVLVGNTDPGLTNPTFDKIIFYGGTEISSTKVLTGAEETATVSVTVRVSDTSGEQSEAVTSTITVTGADDAPTVDAVALITTDASTAKQFTLTATDPEGNVSATGWLLSTPPAKGIAAINTNGVDCSFDPNGEFASLGVNDTEDVTFGVTVSDDTGLVSVERTVTIRVTGAAAAPVAINSSTSMTEDEATEKTVDLSLLCAAGTAAISSYSIVAQPTDATLDLDSVSGLCGITLDTSAFQSLLAGQSTTRPFTFKCTDANGNSSNVATYTITITGIDDSPVAGEINLSLDAGLNESGGATYTDADSGLFSGTAFEFVGSLTDVSSGATTGVGTIVWQNATGATVGSLAPGRFQFRSGSDFATLPDGQSRTVRQGYRVRDAQGNYSATNYINVTVIGTYLASSAPVLSQFNLQTTAGQPVTYDLINSTADADGDIDFWFVVSQALDGNGTQKGIITLESDGTYGTGRLRFAPGNDFDGILAGDSEVVTAQISVIDLADNTGNTINVDIEVTGVSVGSAPDAQNIDLVCEYNATVAGQCVATDVNNDLNASGFLKASDPAKGTLTVSATGAIAFDPAGAFDTLLGGNSEAVTGTYTASDDLANVSAPANIRITVTNSASVGSAPVVNNRSRTADYQSTGIQGGIGNHTTDPDNDIDPNGYTITTNVAEGLLNFTNDGVWTFIPNGDFNDLTSGQSRAVFFEVTATDVQGNVSAPGRVTITVQNTSIVQQSAPVVQDVSVSVDADATLTGQQVTATDADGDLNATGYATSTAFSPISDGVLTFNTNGSWSYDPNGVFDSLLTGSTATRSFTYTASDDAGNVSSPATVTITINGVATAMSEPTYPPAAMAALMNKFPWSASDMNHFMQLPSAYPADITATQSGSWTDAATWGGGGIPQAGDNVKIPYGKTVTFNEARTASFSGNKAYGFVEVHGTLQFPSFMNVRLRCDTLWGAYGAHLKIASGNATTITEISIPSNGNINIANDPSLLTRGIVWHGTIDVKDYAAGTVNEKTPFIDCPHGSHPIAGATSITLASTPVSWFDSDNIIVPQTEMDDQSAAMNWEEESRSINGNVSTASVSFTTPLVYNHDDLEATNLTTPVKDFGDGTGAGGDRPTLAIVNMTRQIKFTSEGGEALPPHQRPHFMFMHRTTGENIHFEGVEVTAFGRTNKLVRARTPGELAIEGITIAYDTNIKARYPIHLHWVGWDPVTDLLDWDNLPVVRRCVINGSPGWGFAQHNSACYAEDNIAYNVFCGFASEVGTEIGWWKGNIAIHLRARRSSGLTGFHVNTKNGAFINTNDYWATGQAYGLVSRQINVQKSDRGWNRAYGGDGDTFSWMHRPGNWSVTGDPNWISSTRDWGLSYIDSRNWKGPAGEEFGGALAYTPWTSNGQVEPDQPGMGVVQHLQATAVHRCIHVIKSGPVAEHDVRVFFDDIIGSGCTYGLEYQYTQHYSTRRFVFHHSTRFGTNAGEYGFDVFNNTPDMLMAYGKIGGFGEGFHTTHFSTNDPQPVAGAWQFVIDSIQFGSQGGLQDNNLDWPDFLPTRTGGDGISGQEDRAYNSTFLNPLTGTVQTWGAPPNPYGTKTPSFNLYRTTKASTANNFILVTQWAWATRSNEWRGTVADAYGSRQVPPFYGTNALSRTNNSFDIMDRGRDPMGWLLHYKGYWLTAQTGGQAYVEDDFWYTPRDSKARTKLTMRIYLASDVPGVNGVNPSSFFPVGRSPVTPFTLNGVKP